MATVSIVIPLYNKGFIISETLDSVLAQTFADFEVVIVNDGSTDSSFEIVSQFSDERILLIQQENKGAAAARNLGIEKATSNLIAFLDADDFWYPNHLEELVKLYTDFPNCGMYCNRFQTRIAKNKTLNNSYSYSVSDDYRGIVPDFFEASLINRVATSSSILVSKQVLLDNNCFNSNVSSGQDVELWTKIGITNSVAINNKSTVIYNFDLPNSLAKTPITKKILMDFSQFAAAEKENKSLKKFLDIYRLEYALQFKIAGSFTQSQFYLKDISTKIPLKTRFLLQLPVFALRFFLKIKHYLKRFGIDFTVYH
jgi:glycosyltransferase involved in cell wall biosynthesis